MRGRKSWERNKGNLKRCFSNQKFWQR